MQKKFTRGETNLLKGLKTQYFHLIMMNKLDLTSEEKEELNNIKNKNGLIDYRKLNRLIDARTRDINDELVKK